MKNWPRKAFGALVATVSALNLLYIWKCPLDLCGDEAHYWEWARHLDICYYSKGPIVAYIIWLATHIGGHTPFAIRSAAVLLSAGSMMIVYFLGRRLFKSELAGFLGVLLLVSAPMINIGAAVLTIDSPLCFFWLATVGAWYLAIFEGRTRWWYIGGLCASIGFLAKFTALFVVPGLLLFLLLSKADRHWLRSPHSYCAMLLGLLGFVPFLIWNAQHGWVTVHHLLALGGAGRRRLFDPMGLPVWIFQTALALSPIIFCFMTYGICRSTILALREAHRGHLFCQVFVWPVLIFYFFIALHKHVPVNWPFTSFLTGMIATGAMLAQRLEASSPAPQRLRNAIIAAVFLGIIMSLICRYTYIFYPLMERIGIPPSKDHAAVQFMGWRELGERISELMRQMVQETGQEPFMFSDNYRWASVMGFYTDKHYPSYFINVGQRHNQYDFWPGIAGFVGRNAVFVGRMIEPLAKSFERVEPQPPLRIIRSGIEIKRFDIYKCYGFKGWNPPEKKRRY